MGGTDIRGCVGLIMAAGLLRDTGKCILGCLGSASMG